MRTIAIAAAAVVLAACSSSASSSSLPATHDASSVAMRAARATPKGGIYVSQFDASSVYGYAGLNKRNAPPICGETSGDFVADVATDSKGDLIAPSQQGETIYVYQGPAMCGPTAATLSDPYGLPVDVASANALTGKIAVANIEDDGPISNPPPGSITICTVASGCTKNLTNSQMNRVGAVALDNRGDCWASATNASGLPTLTFFAHCAGKGRAATGYQNSGYGGLELDKKGNLLALDFNDAALYVYSGCKPACALVAGPFALQGESFYGKLNRDGTTFAAADYQDGKVDIYKYDTTSLTYQFSFDQDLSRGSEVEGIAFAPGR
jgi:hypothetical protein